MCINGGSAATRLKSYFVACYGYDLAVKRWDHFTFRIRSQIGDEHTYRVNSEEIVIANGRKCISLYCFQYFSLFVFFSFF